jgi:O-antigen/teichoic acid export membrane protein
MNKKFADSIYLIGQPLLINVVGLPATVYFIRTLGPTGFGQWTLATSLVAAMAFISNLGLRTLFVRSIAQFPENAENALAEQLGLRSLLACIGSLLAIFLCLILNYPTIVLYCVIVTAVGSVITAQALTLGDVLNGFERFKILAVVNLITGIVITSITVVAVWRGANPLGLSIAYLSGPVINLILSIILVNKNLVQVRIQWNIMRYYALLREVKLLGTQSFLGTLNEQVEQLLVPKLVGITAFGYFSAGSILASRLVIFPDGIATSYYPKIAKSLNINDNEGTQQVAQLLLFSLIVCVALAVLVTFLAEPIAQILFPRTASICRDIIKITIWSIPLKGIMCPMMYALQAAGKHDEYARWNNWATVCGSCLSFFLISRLGILGASWSWSMRSFLSILFLLPAFVRVFPGVMPRIPIIRICCCGLMMSAFLWGALSIRLPLLLVTTLGSCLALLVYSSTILLLRVVKIPSLKQLIP